MPEPTTLTREQLASGCHLYPGRDGTWRYAMPGDRFVRIAADPAVLRAAQRRLNGVPPVPGDNFFTAGEPTHAAVEEFVGALRARGVAVAHGEDRGPVRPLGRVWIDGDNPVGDGVAALLKPGVDLRRGRVDEQSVEWADVVLCCAGWLPDARWQQIDAWCEHQGRPWHMSYLDGDRWYLGPMWVPGRTAAYRDVRARRLAACGLADELAAHWTYLDTETVLPPVPWPHAAGAAVLAGMLVADLLAFRDSGAPAADGVQLGIDLAAADIRRHPVLPLPRSAR